MGEGCEYLRDEDGVCTQDNEDCVFLIPGERVDFKEGCYVWQVARADAAEKRGGILLCFIRREYGPEAAERALVELATEEHAPAPAEEEQEDG